MHLHLDEHIVVDDIDPDEADVHLNEHMAVDDIDPNAADLPIQPRQPSPTPSISSESEDWTEWNMYQMAASRAIPPISANEASGLMSEVGVPHSQSSNQTEWNMYFDQIAALRANPPMSADEAIDLMPVPPAPSASNLQQLTHYQGIAYNVIRNGISRDPQWLRNDINQGIVEAFFDPDLVVQSDSSED